MGEFTDNKILYSDIDCHFVPIKRPGILTYVFSLDVTPSDILNFYSSNVTSKFKSEYYEQKVLSVCKAVFRDKFSETVAERVIYTEM